MVVGSNPTRVICLWFFSSQNTGKFRVYSALHTSLLWVKPKWISIKLWIISHQYLGCFVRFELSDLISLCSDLFNDCSHFRCFLLLLWLLSISCRRFVVWSCLLLVLRFQTPKNFTFGINSLLWRKKKKEKNKSTSQRLSRFWDFAWWENNQTRFAL